MSSFLHAQDNPILIGPDSESLQWVTDIAQRSGLEYTAGNKTRLGDREVRVSLPEIKLQGRNVVLIDDVISSGETMAVCSRQCLTGGALRVDVLVTHPLFAAGAEDRLHQAGVENIWSTDSIPHKSNTIALAPLLANAIASITSQNSLQGD